MNYVHVFFIFIGLLADSAISATFVSKPTSIPNNYLGKRTSLSLSAEDMQSKIKGLDSTEEYFKSEIEKLDVEELELRRQLMKLNKINLLEDDIKEMDELKKTIASQIKLLDAEQLEMEVEAQMLRSHTISQQQLEDRDSNISTMSLLGGGFLAAAAIRSSLMNREEKQRPKIEGTSNQGLQLNDSANAVLGSIMNDNITSFESRARTIISSIPTNHQLDLETIATRIKLLSLDMKKLVHVLMSLFENELFKPRGRNVNSQHINNKNSHLVRNVSQRTKHNDFASKSVQTMVANIHDRSQSLATTVKYDKHDAITDDQTQVVTNMTNAIALIHAFGEESPTKTSKFSAYPKQEQNSPDIMEIQGTQTKTPDGLSTSSSFRAIGIGAFGRNVIENISADSIYKENNFVSLSFADERKIKLRAAINSCESRLAALVDEVKFCVIICEAADKSSAESAKLFAKQAKSSGILTFCVVSSPFYFEGTERLKCARNTIESLQSLADTVIDVPSDTLLEMIPRNSSMKDAYSIIDNVIGSVVTDILELANKKGLTNEMFDVSSVLTTEFKNQSKSLEINNALPCSGDTEKIKSKQRIDTFNDTVHSPKETLITNETIRETRPVHSFDSMNDFRTFGVGDAGCSAIVKLHPSSFNATDIFGVHFDLSVLSPLKKQDALDTFLIPIDDDSDKASQKQKMKKAIDRSGDELSVLVDDAKLCVITCDAADVFSSQAAITLVQKAKEKGALTICLVTLPFCFEGSKRMKRADKTIGILKETADTVIVIPSDPILELIPDDTDIEKAYAMIDDIVSKGVAGIIGLVGKQGLINANFKDIETIQKGAGIGSMGLGSSTSKNAAKEAAFAAVSSPLLGEVMDSVRSIVLSVSGGRNMSLSDVRSVVNIVYKCVDESTDVAVSAFVDESVEDEISVTLFAMGGESSSHLITVQDTSNVTREYGSVECESQIEIAGQNVSNLEHISATKLQTMRVEEILSFDQYADYSSSIIYPYQSIESKLKRKRKNAESSSTTAVNSLFEAKKSSQKNPSKAIVDSLFMPKTRHSRNSGLFSKRTKTRTTKLNLLQFSILETSTPPGMTNSHTHNVGLFGKSTHHKNYIRFSFRKRSSLSNMNLLLQMLDKTMQTVLP